VESPHILWSIFLIFLYLCFVLVYAPVLTWVERRFCAWFQDRCGPNRVGPFGLFQPIADAIKLFFKEDMRPDRADRFLYTIAPGLVFLMPLLAFACIPLGRDVSDGTSVYPMQVGDLNVGILFLFAVGSLGVYGISFGGWASNNKFAQMGALRAAAQLISYELALGLAVICLVMQVGSLSPREIIEYQATHGWLFWGMQTPAFLIFLIAAFAETNRLPFDMPECEAELVAGHHTEYSSMRFALFPFGEYVAMTTMAGFIVLLWFGGWHHGWLPGMELTPIEWTEGNLESIGWFQLGLQTAWPIFIFFIKMWLVLIFFVWVRWTFPRFRYDQLMALGWKVLVPLALVWVVITGLVNFTATP
jgi:NADH-quinone oxidoreductase subunit H